MRLRLVAIALVMLAGVALLVGDHLGSTTAARMVMTLSVMCSLGAIGVGVAMWRRRRGTTARG